MAKTNISATEFAAQSFDYLIVGGGTAGLVVAARLSENPLITVGVVEAGVDRSDDLLVRVPGLGAGMWENTDYSWIFKTEPQGRNKLRHAWTRGKMLGGSSNLNMLSLAKPSKKCLDDWATLGNPGWDWDGLLPYFRKAMTVNQPPPDTEKQLETSRIQHWLSGGNGPIQVSWSPAEYTSLAQHMVPELGRHLGLANSNAAITESIGYYDQGTSIDMKAGRRSSAVFEYYQPNSHRSNLSLVTDAMVQRILFNGEDSHGNKVATGVEFAVQGQTFRVSAKKEVVLCAGAIQSPQILELSGIGSRAILKKFGIDVVVDNPAVGENLQDHIVSGLGYEVAPGISTFEELKKPGVMETLIGEYMQNPVGPLVNTLTSSIFLAFSDVLSDKSTLTADVERLVSDSSVADNSGLAKQMKLHKDRLLSSADCAAWVMPIGGGMDTKLVEQSSGILNHLDPGNYISFVAIVSHPLSRGSIHIQSPDVNVQPIIDPRYLSHPADIKVLADTLRVIDTQWIQTEPVASRLKSGSRPPRQPAHESFSPDKAEDWVQENFSTMWHTIGTCSMLPREDEGVVDPTLKVYGTANLRVIDSSIVPLQVQGNMQSIIYAVAEKGADLIKETW